MASDVVWISHASVTVPLRRLPVSVPQETTKHIMLGVFPTGIDLLTLRRLVQEKLCELGMLEIGQFPITERTVVKSGRPCGVYYCLHGPRSVKLTAIADFERASLICYGSDGVRSVEERLNT